MENMRIFTCALILCIGTIQAHGKYYSKSVPAVHDKEKVTNLRFFLHDVISGKNPTAIMVARPNQTHDKSPVPFGSVFAVDDHIRVGPEPTSEIIGNAQGLYVSSSQDPKKFTIVLYIDYAFTKGEFNGSSISIFSRNQVYEPVRETAIVGGRGKFKMAKGFVSVKTARFNATTGDAILEYKATVYHY